MYREIENSELNLILCHLDRISFPVIATEHPSLSSRPNGVSGEISPCAALSRDDNRKGEVLSRDELIISNSR